MWIHKLFFSCLLVSVALAQSDGGFLSGLFNSIGDTIRNTAEGVTDFTEGVVDNVQDFFDFDSDDNLIGNALDAAGDFVQSAQDGIEDVSENILDALSVDGDGFLGSLGDTFEDLVDNGFEFVQDLFNPSEDEDVEPPPTNEEFLCALVEQNVEPDLQNARDQLKLDFETVLNESGSIESLGPFIQNYYRSLLGNRLVSIDSTLTDGFFVNGFVRTVLFAVDRAILGESDAVRSAVSAAVINALASNGIVDIFDNMVDSVLPIVSEIPDFSTQVDNLRANLESSLNNLIDNGDFNSFSADACQELITDLI